MPKARKNDKQLKNAHTHLQAGQWDDAASIYKTILKKTPKSRDALLGLAEVARYTHSPKDARKFARKALKLDPEDSQARLHNLLATAALDGPHAALPELEELCEAEPELYEAALEAARLLHEAGDDALAAKEIERALALQDDDPRSHLLCAQIYQQLDRYKDAIESFNTARKLAPNTLIIYLKHADLLTEKGEFTKALQLLDEARSNCGFGAPELTAQQASLYALKGDWEQARNLYQRLTNHNPEMWRLWLNLSMAHLATEELTEAQEALEEALALAPDHWEPQLLQGQLLEAFGQLPEAIAALRASIDADESQWTPHNELGRLLLTQGKNHIAEALTLLQRAHDLAPDAPEPLLNLVLAHQSDGDSDAASEHLKQLLALPSLTPEIEQQAQRLQQVID